MTEVSGNVFLGPGLVCFLLEMKMCQARMALSEGHFLQPVADHKLVGKSKVLSFLNLPMMDAIHKGMGLVYAPLRVKKSYEQPEAIEISFLVDSGAVYSLIPAAELKKIGVTPHRTMTFVMADGTKIERQVGDAYFEWHGEGGAAPVIFGEAGDEALLGATTLESLGLVLNPFSRELRPMRMLMV